MTPSPEEQMDQLFNRYLDGELHDEEKEAFLRAVGQSADLRRRLELAERIGAGVRRLHPPASSPRIAAPRRSVPFARKLAYAAAIALLAAVWIATRPPPPPPLEAQRVYDALVARFEPAVVCDTPEKFREYAQEAFGQGLAARFDAGIALLGWTPLDTYSPDASPGRILLARTAEGVEIAVLIQPRAGRDPAGASAGGVQIFKARLGGLEAFEITPLGVPSVLPLLRAN